MKTRRLTHLWATATILAVFSALFAGAGHQSESVSEYTGCLNLARGVVKDIAVGAAPLEPCATGHGWVELHLSSGDITAVAPGSGLSGGSTNGSATLQLDPALGTPGTINDPSNLVHWTRLKGVPEALADGTAGGGVSGVVAFDASGIFAVPSGVTALLIEAWGAGGGGGGGTSFEFGAPCRGGGGAGAGGFAKAVVPVVPGLTYDVVVGAGGAAGSSGSFPGSGTAGGPTSFGPVDAPLVVAEGGEGGGAASSSSNGTGGTGGRGTLDAVVIAGEAGTGGVALAAPPFGFSCPSKPSGSGIGGKPAFGTRPPRVAVAGDGGFGSSIASAGGPGYMIIQW